jgi:predicted enzyme related to lactoylglutathione lyase
MNPVQISLVLAAHDPKALSHFYAALFSVNIGDGMAENHRILDLNNGLRLEIYRPSQHRPFPAAGRALSICLKFPAHHTPLVELDQHVSYALQMGASILEPARLEPFGAECWMNDPEGNAVLLLVPIARSGQSA